LHTVLRRILLFLFPLLFYPGLQFVHIGFLKLSIKVHFKDSSGNLIKTVEANEGDDILAIAHEYDIDLEGELFILIA
jgi:hypothetical protein